MKDYYEVLGVRRSASAAEIALAYKGRRTQYHPDKYQISDAETLRWATTRMQEVNEAYAVLSDGQRRARFDAGNASSESDAAARPGDATVASASLRELLHARLAPYDGYSRTFFAPRIPIKKLSAALQNYGGDVNAEDVLALVDTTIFGGSKEGILITETQMRMKEIATPMQAFEWSRVKSVAAADKTVYVDGRKVIDCHMVEPDELKSLFAVAAAFVASLQPASAAQARPEPKQAKTSRSLPEKYSNMYSMAKREFLALCQMIQKFELQLGDDFIDRDNATAYFGYLEQGLRDTGKAERAWAILGEIAVLSKAIVVFSDTGKPVPPVLTQERDEDSQLVAELRALLRFLLNLLEDVEQKARTAQFFKR